VLHLSVKVQHLGAAFAEFNMVRVKSMIQNEP